MDCRFLIGDSWNATFVEAPGYSGIIHFGQRGPDNPFRAISHANTNALIRLSQNAIKMPQAEAERIVHHIADAFGVDRSKYEKPEIYPERMFQYDLGMYTAAYRKKGSDPINQLNYTLDFSIKATSPTTAVLVMYSETPSRRQMQGFQRPRLVVICCLADPENNARGWHRGEMHAAWRKKTSV